jgi:hypothetical protein
MDFRKSLRCSNISFLDAQIALDGTPSIPIAFSKSSFGTFEYEKPASVGSAQHNGRFSGAKIVII